MLSTKDICKRLGVASETVKRWCRSGKLKATKNSNKEGYDITNEAFGEFLRNHPKYARRYMPPIPKIKLVEKGNVGHAWIKHEFVSYYLECPHCNRISPDDKRWEFCPHCGWDLRESPDSWEEEKE